MGRAPRRPARGARPPAAVVLDRGDARLRPAAARVTARRRDRVAVDERVEDEPRGADRAVVAGRPRRLAAVDDDHGAVADRRRRTPPSTRIAVPTSMPAPTAVVARTRARDLEQLRPVAGRAAAGARRRARSTSPSPSAMVTLATMASSVAPASTSAAGASATNSSRRPRPRRRRRGARRRPGPASAGGRPRRRGVELVEHERAVAAGHDDPGRVVDRRDRRRRSSSASRGRTRTTDATDGASAAAIALASACASPLLA